MVAGIIALRWMLGSALHPAVRLLVSILTGACLYIGAIEMANVPAYHYLKGRAALLVHRAFDSLRSL